MSLHLKAGSVTFENVTKKYGAVTAIDDVSFSIAPGHLVTLLGPSGCGKTTTLRMIAGLEHASSGRILIGGKDVTNLPATDRDVSMVFQSYALFPHMTVGENVAYGLTVGGLKKAEAAERAEEGLALVGLAGYASRLPSELSGGQQQRVAVARALVLEPEVLLLDEPLSNLDAKLRRKVREEIRDLQQKLGLTAVYVTHDQEEALAVSDRIIVMNRSIIAQEGTPRELYEAPSSAFIADFIGDANLITGEVISANHEKAKVRIDSIEYELPSRGLRIGSAQIAVRPDSILLEPAQGSSGPGSSVSGSSESGSAGAKDQIGIRGNVTHSTYLGNQMHYSVDSPLGELFVVDYRIDNAIKAGSDISITFATKGMALIAP
ncbi:sugar ABC transporter substrate-binding protein [Kiloniella litopenaei]|uniref:Sugar ABC transporter substrate-binding protein n=1 Tax=Kiloniella litopenaei TaxID=1549748 RepID=A0A0M2R7W8_9PROT|nr:ABC transporter ATP-binding protein [Kiloniella litopenaei]KKJ75623.1 sugar ABC transporter substrate-binding protein [Kiloniella litopenaei]